MSGKLRPREDEDLSSGMMRTTGTDKTNITNDLSDAVSKTEAQLNSILVRVRCKGVNNREQTILRNCLMTEAQKWENRFSKICRCWLIYWQVRSIQKCVRQSGRVRKGEG